MAKNLDLNKTTVNVNSPRQQVVSTIADILVISPGDVDLNAVIPDDLNLNPSELADFYRNLEAEYGIAFEKTELQQLETISDLIDLIEDKQLEI